MTQKQFTRDELIAWEKKHGLDSGSVEERTPERRVPYKPPPQKRDIERDIYNAVYNASRAVSIKEIAEAVGVKKTTWLRGHVERLVEERHLNRVEQPYRPGINKHYFTAAH